MKIYDYHFSPVILAFTKAIFLCLTLISASSIAKSSSPPSYNMPTSIQQKICQKLTIFNKPCDTNKPIQYRHNYKLDNDRVLLFFTLKNTSPIRQVAVTLNNKGHWKVGAAFDGVPKKIIPDGHSGYWMHLQSYNEGTSPSLYYSRNGANWDYMLLPQKRLRGSTIEEMPKLCYDHNHVWITLDTEIFVPKNKRVISSWMALPNQLIDVSKSLKTAKKAPPTVWQKTENRIVNTLKCNHHAIINNSWIITENKTNTTFQHRKKELNIVIKHTMSNPAIVTKKSSIRAKYAIQVGVYRNRLYANQLINTLQKAGFRTYTQTLLVNNSEITKIYSGTFSNKTHAQQTLARLKKRFSNRKPLQSAFLVKTQ